MNYFSGVFEEPAQVKDNFIKINIEISIFKPSRNALDAICKGQVPTSINTSSRPCKVVSNFCLNNRLTLGPSIPRLMMHTRDSFSLSKFHWNDTTSHQQCVSWQNYSQINCYNSTKMLWVVGSITNILLLIWEVVVSSRRNENGNSLRSFNMMSLRQGAVLNWIVYLTLLAFCR